MQCIQNIIFHNQVGFIPDMKHWFSIRKSINIIYHINGLEEKKHINLIDAKNLIKLSMDFS